MSMQFSPTRALARRFALLNLLGNAPLVALIFYLHRQSSVIDYAYLVVVAVPTFLMLIDLAVVFCYIRRIQKSLSVSTVEEAFRYGVTWRGLSQMARRAKRITAAKMQLEQVLPELKDDRAYADAMSRRDYFEAAVIVERVERRKKEGAKRQERAQRRLALRSAEAAALCTEAQMIGIPEEQVRACGNDLGALRALLIKGRQRFELLRSASQYECETLIREILDERSFDAAESTLLTIKALLERAGSVGATDEVLTWLRLGMFEDAKNALVEAEKRVEWQRLEETFRVHIEKRNAPERPPLAEKLRELGKLEFGSRLFRKKRYELERELKL